MPWVRVVAGALGVLLAYYTAPLRWTEDSVGVALLGTVAGIGVLTWAIVGQIRRQLRGDGARVPALVTLMLLVVAVFAWSYLALETARPGQMAGLETRTDSLYFTLQVLATVGLGDVHAVGQAGRALVAVQMVFDLVFIGAAGSVLAATVKSHVRQAPGHTSIDRSAGDRDNEPRE
ncbi:potassium channel family protein [Nocardioides jishulii]|uniref:Two pore domain potassium channel family protein n=1 Tax=Nocardioides jishulii TaxID=2575440 RepID=A0A4U2YPU7_9ACTN|nr:potassium channel family protein [Nocardioides jishulii]QCX27888.1 two pore domain potassium channel family protein [Nocardioides jishulii]TKI62695.1 two pore domain potassium channel family protein [Nocardioides jishulii]